MRFTTAKYVSQKMHKVSGKLKCGQNRMNVCAAPNFVEPHIFRRKRQLFKDTRKLAGSIIRTE
jgi:hypothetical protein